MPLKLNWGLVGGGETSQIGSAHRIGARLDGHVQFVAGALNIDLSRALSVGATSLLSGRT